MEGGELLKYCRLPTKEVGSVVCNEARGFIGRQLRSHAL